MYGYGSHRNHAYSAYGHNRYTTGEWYGDEPGPSSSQTSDHYAYDPHAYDPQYGTMDNYYNGGYHEAGAPSRYAHYPMNSDADGYGLYQPTPVHQHTKSARPPRAPKAMRDRERELERGRGRKGKEDEGDREVTPPPVPSPSPEYLALAADAPSTLSEISSSRKLLVLDLNGTLVFRSPHSSRTRNRGFPRLRPTYPRPYMRAFREYLFAPETKAWLDVMVWSSAQPHSVGDMVDKCFGSWKRELVAVWARDTLGLSNDHYHRKVQTLKDLSRPWSTLPALLTPLPPSPSPPSERSTSPPSSSPLVRSSSPVHDADSVAPQVHSALTTLLLDDSPSKAALQPYNHFCIPEYTQERRNKDLDSFQKEQEWLLALERRKLLQAQLTKDEKAAQVASAASSPRRNGSEHVEPIPKSRKRKRKSKESAQADSTLPASHLNTSEEDTFSSSSSSSSHASAPASSPTPPGLPTSSTSPPAPKKESRNAKRRKHFEEPMLTPEVKRPDLSYDETLLAVVGVLDEVHCQRNVAAWVRAGGLWGPGGVPTHLKQAVRERSSEGMSEGSAEGDERLDGVSGIVEADGAKKKRKPRHRTLRKQAEAEALRRAEEGDAVMEVDESTARPAGNDEVTQTAPTDSKGIADLPADAPEAPAALMWFEDSEVIVYWATRGREALETLGIPVEHGMEG